MAFKRCPGSLSFAQPKIEVIPCPDCAQDVEIWSDEATGKCPGCKKTVIRHATQSCVDWCKYAVDCLGKEKFAEYGEMKATVRKAALAKALEKELADDKEALADAQKVIAYAEMILSKGTPADPTVVLATATLSPLCGGPDQGCTCRSEDGEEEKLSDVRAILQTLASPDELVAGVCQLIVRLHCERGDDTPEYDVLHDAYLLAGAERRRRREKKPVSEELLGKLRTDAAREAAHEMREFMATDE